MVWPKRIQNHLPSPNTTHRLTSLNCISSEPRSAYGKFRWISQHLCRATTCWYRKKRNQSSWTLRGTILHCHHCRSQTSRPACTADKRLAAPPTAVRIDLSFRKDVPSVHAKCWSILLSTHELSPVLVFMVLNPTPQTQPAVPPAVPWTSAGGTTSMKGLRAVGNTSCTRCRETMAKVIGAPALEAMDEGWRMKKDEESAACWSRWHKMRWDVVRWLVVPCHPLTKVVALPKHLGPPASHMLASPQHHPEAASQ